MIVVLVVGFTAIQPAFCAEKPEIAKFQSFVFSTLNEAEKEAEIQGILKANPQLANAVTSDGEPILMWVIGNLGVGGDMERKSLKLAEILVSKGANINALDRDGNPIIFKFAMFARVPQIRFLTSHNVNVNVKDKEDSRSPLHWVALLKEFDENIPKSKEMIEKTIEAAGLLLGAKADINAKDKRGETPLHSAAFLGNIRMVEFLVLKGADINAKDKDGYTPLSMVKGRLKEKWANAKEKQVLPPVIEFLEKHGGKE